jgi:hypothetical protein
MGFFDSTIYIVITNLINQSFSNNYIQILIKNSSLKLMQIIIKIIHKFMLLFDFLFVLFKNKLYENKNIPKSVQ